MKANVVDWYNDCGIKITNSGKLELKEKYSVIHGNFVFIEITSLLLKYNKNILILKIEYTEPGTSLQKKVYIFDKIN